MAKLLSAFLMWMALSGVQVVRAEPFFDPTRPPAALLTLQDGTTGSAARAESPLVLQSILRSPQHQTAMISGRSVALGQSIRGYQLRSLESQKAELEGPQGCLTLWLIPSFHSDPAPVAAKATSHQGDKK
ncbi:MAG: hypothetical protein H6R19_1381 [Proteobacteria bacterium]|nr:hypothetical protein [Pseudomonadota bacterium]